MHAYLSSIRKQPATPEDGVIPPWLQPALDKYNAQEEARPSIRVIIVLISRRFPISFFSRHFQLGFAKSSKTRRISDTSNPRV